MWLTKEKGYGRANEYQLWKYHPKAFKSIIRRTTGWSGDGFIASWSALLFHRFTKTRLKPGEIREVKSIVFKFK